MKEKEREEHESRHTQGVKKKCKKKRSPVDEDLGKPRHYRSDEPDAGRRKEHRAEPRGREFYDDMELRRKERDHDNYPETRKKDRELEEADRRREGRRERENEEVESRRKESEGGARKESEGGARKRCAKYKEARRSPARRRDNSDTRVKIKEEPVSDSDSPRSPADRDRSRSPRHDREDRKPSNIDALVSVKEEKHDWGRGEDKDKKKPIENKAKPDFTLSGKLAEETNVVNGVLIKYSEPEEARKPKVRWRFYPFKGESGLPVLHLHRQSAYLIGRDRKIADLPVDHPSCSKQHAVLQYRLVPYTRVDGSKGKRVRPYIIDLESANGTFVNNKKVEPKKYVELLERDVIKFAFSSREYVLLHENSKDAHLDDDVQ